ncbi:MAG: radical SAM protein, partial [Nitrospirota bacterium]|nr:radical SAM protein [Nitrospirota bacterium]
MILIYPPVARPCEPPAGIARLSGALDSHGVSHRVLDANIEALLHIVQRRHTGRAADRWTTRAFRNLSKNYSSLKDLYTYDNIDRYKRAVIDLERAVERSAAGKAIPGLANYRHRELSPLRSSDLIRAADYPEDNPYYPYFSKRLPELLENNGTAMAGFSLNYLSQALCTFAMIGFIRKYSYNVKIVLGGGLVTSWLKNPDWHDPFKGLVDRFISGPGEVQMLSMMGIDERKEIYSTPSYDPFPLDDYLAPGRILPYSASSGCYWNKCSFCPEKAENNPYVPAPVERAMDDLKALVAKTSPALVHLLDNSISPALLKKLAERPLGVPWYGFARISSLLTDIDFCSALKSSGCAMLKLGLESGDQGVLDQMQKGIDLETASRVLRTLKKAGIAAYVYLLFGTPAETLSEARNT